MNPRAIHSGFHLSTSRLSKIVLVFFLLFTCCTSLLSQDKEELQKERDRISEEISLTNKLIEETRVNRSKLEGELSLLNRKINLREDLIRSYRGEITLYNRQLKKNRDKINELEVELAKLKDAYAKSIRFAQRTNNSQDRLMFIFASDDFFQAVKRVRYLQQYTRYRKKQADKIVATKEELHQLNKELLSLIEEKDRLISAEESTKDNLKSDLNEQKSVVTNLKQEEKSLIQKLKKQERQREKLNKEIQRIIEAEIRASKKDNSGVYELTPEAAALSENFEKNKGKLPWPVERGVITSKFGPNPHPVLAGITIPNNGIDIATNENAAVRAVFEGTVSAVFSIAGAGQNVIVNHGGYRSVYSNLKEVFVSKGQKVNNKDAIGTVLTEESSGKTEAHIEIWKVDKTGTTKQDPALWIYRK